MAGEHIPRGFPMCECGTLAKLHRPSHTPNMWPVCGCGAEAIRHRVKHHHRGDGDICDCGLPRQNHLTETGYRYQYVGIDGEGMGRNPHKYVLLTAASECGKVWTLEDLDGLKSLDILQWVIDNLHDSRVFSYSFGYDITHFIKDLPNSVIHALLRPSLRYEKGRLQPVQWNGFKLDWLQGRLTIQQKGRRVVIWDLFKFFQCSFVKALENWGVPTLDIEAMKLRRGKFKRSEMPRIRSYNRDECVQLATLARKLIETHRRVGLTLTAYYGAGSTASAAISAMKADDYRSDPPEEMTEPIACGFFGGWFEHSLMGLIPEVWGYDISSAYPYQLYQLPCLQHGTWTHVTKDVKRALESCTTALVRYRYRGRAGDAWAPFAYRDPKGSICHPYHGSGWAWLPEIRAVLDSPKGTWGKTYLDEAWVYNSTCDCHPFKDVATYYRRRTEVGKDAAGIVLKLGINGIAGKLMQSVGPNPKHQCWVWAGLVTSGTRAQMIQAIASAPSPKDIIGIATDGIYSRVRLSLPSPRDTGTSDLAKPLGGWEEKHYPEGMLFLKPGIYMSLRPNDHAFEGKEELCIRCKLPKDDHGDIRARGIGRRELEKQKPELIKAWERGERSFTVTAERFYGAKTCVNAKHRRSPRYGQWNKMPVKINFVCPNRTANMGLLWKDEPSAPYDRSMLSPEKYEAIRAEVIAYEQP